MRLKHSSFLFIIVICSIALGKGETFNYLLDKGWALCENESYLEAVKYFDRAISLNSTNPEAWRGKGYAYTGEAYDKEGSNEYALAIENYEKAIKCFEKAIELNSSYAEVYINMADPENMMDNYKKALELINKSISIDPNNAEAINVKGTILYRMGKYDESIEMFRKSANMDPNYASAWSNICYFVSEQNKGDSYATEESNKACQKAAAIHNTNVGHGIAVEETEAERIEKANVVPAREIISKIKRGELVNYSHVTIEGDLNISDINAPNSTIISSPIKITDCIIYGFVNLNDAIFQESANFERTEFMKSASFIGTQFEGDAVLDNSRFEEQSRFIGSRFNNSALFHYAKFDGFSNFAGAKFSSMIDFHNSRFNDSALFRSVLFQDEANFEETTFLGPANFRETNFDVARFSGARFHELADFNAAKFNKSADFSGTKFDKELYFNNVKFAELLISWESLRDRLVSNGPTYLSLIKNFKDMERFEDADNCYYQYREEKKRDRVFGWAKFFDYISWLSCGYGVRWQHPIIGGIVIVLLFGMYYESYNSKGRIMALFHSSGAKNSHKNDLVHNFKKSLGFSLMMLLSLPADWSRFGKDEYTKFVERHWFSSIVERLIGWGLMLLLISTLTRLMVRY